MRNNLIQLLLGIAFLSLSHAAFSQTPNDAYYSGRIWVKFNNPEQLGLANSGPIINSDDFARAIGGELAKDMGLISAKRPFHFAKADDIATIAEIRFESDQSEEFWVRMLEALPTVNYAERVPIMRPTVVPNDLGPAAGNGNQYGLWIISAPQAWDISTGNTEITVAVVDDAVLTTHPDLIPNLLPGYDVADGDNDPMPNVAAMSHGTHVAGIIGAATNNGQGVASIGYSLKILPVKSSNEPEFVTNAYEGVIWAADNGADVINMSWGGSGFSQSGQDIMNYAYDKGCVNIAAAGNDGVNSVFYPAGYNNVISVASTTSDDTKSSFSNYGDWIDISAPGSQILSTYIGTNFSPEYAALSGTSMASPMVAGLAGLVLSVNPELTQAQVESCLLNTADDHYPSNSNYLGQLGSGRINAYQAVLCAQSLLNAPPIATINAESSVICPGGIVQYFGSSMGGPGVDYNWTFPGGIPENSTEQNPMVTYPTPGNYNVSLNITNDFGSDVVTETNLIEVSTNGVDVFFTEDFESGSFDQNNWSVINPDNSNTWSVQSVNGPQNGTKAASANLFGYSATGQRDAMVTAPISFATHSNIELSFQHAHRRRISGASDSLIVYVSTDGGATFPNRVLAAAENGTGSFATGSLSNQNFQPAGADDWCYSGTVGAACFTVDLSDFDGQNNVAIKFESYNDGGNNIYLDNIQLSGNCLFTEAAPEAGFSTQSAGICTGETVQFFDESLNIPTTYEWTFEGGTPATSNLAMPVVSYAAAGTYNVSLTVTNSFGADQITLDDYITVSEAPALVATPLAITICEGESVSLSASGADSFEWSPNVALSATAGETVDANPQSSITYTVTGTSNGCSVTEEIQVIVEPLPVVPEVISQNEVAFAVLHPAEVSGYYGYTTTSTANGWGNNGVNNVSIEAQLVIARDGGAADSLLCNAAQNATELAGNIAVIYRGSCQFGVKALNAQNAGAAAVIIVNNQAGAPIDMAPGDDGANVQIPVIMVSIETGAMIQDQVYAGNATGIIGQFNGGGFVLCPGETMRLAAPGGLDSYLWSNGESSAVIEISEPGTYTFNVSNDSECSLSSETFDVSIFDTTSPVIEFQNNEIVIVNSVNADSYQWYLNGSPIDGATGSSVEFQGDGIYSVEIVDSNGCSTTSNLLDLVFVGLNEDVRPEMALYPVPTNSSLTLRFASPVMVKQLDIIAADGRIVQQLEINNTNSVFELDVNQLSTGSYVLRVTTNERAEQLRFTKIN